MNLCTHKRPDLQSGAINHSATPPRALEKKGFCLACQYMFYIRDMKDGQKPRFQQKPKLRCKFSLWGLHAVRAAWLNPAREFRSLYVTEAALKQFEPILAESAGMKRPKPQLIEKRELDRALDEAVHQGIAADAAPLDEVFVQDLAARAMRKDRAVILMLDQVTDPHNVGAILRSACVFGADGIVMQRRHSPELTGVLAKTASGAVEHVPVAYEINLSDTLDILKKNGFRAIGLDERGEVEIGAASEGAGKIVLVLGAEGAGLRPKVREHCDVLARLPAAGPIASLNVSNAAAVALYAVTQGGGRVPV